MTDSTSKDVDIALRVEEWIRSGPPAAGLSEADRAAIIEDALGSFMAEFVGKAEDELQALDDSALIRCHFWAMNEATR